MSRVKITSSSRLITKSASFVDSAVSRKATSRGVTVAVKMSAVAVRPSHADITRDAGREDVPRRGLHVGLALEHHLRVEDVAERLPLVERRRRCSRGRGTCSSAALRLYAVLLRHRDASGGASLTGSARARQRARSRGVERGDGLEAHAASIGREIRFAKPRCSILYDFRLRHGSAGAVAMISVGRATALLPRTQGAFFRRSSRTSWTTRRRARGCACASTVGRRFEAGRHLAAGKRRRRIDELLLRSETRLPLRIAWCPRRATIVGERPARTWSLDDGPRVPRSPRVTLRRRRLARE